MRFARLVGGASLVLVGLLGAEVLATWTDTGRRARLEQSSGDDTVGRAVIGLMALAGHADALRIWGRWTMDREPEAAATYFERAARKGDLRAAWELGRLKRRPGPGREPAQAASWLEQAAAGGLTEAHFLLGTMYQEGDGVPVDWTKAMAHYEAGAQREDPLAIQALAQARLSGALGLTADQEEANSLLRELDHVVSEQTEHLRLTAQAAP